MGLEIKRRTDESFVIVIGDTEVWVTLLDCRNGRAMIDIDAPRDVDIWREEVWDRLQLERDEA